MRKIHGEWMREPARELRTFLARALKRIESFRYFLAYTKAVCKQWMAILFGETVIGVVYIIWWTIAGPSTAAMVVTFVAAALVAGYFAWRAEYTKSKDRCRLEIRPRLARSRFPLQTHSKTYFTLTMINHGWPVLATNCQVQVRKITKKVASKNGKEWRELDLPQYDLQLSWSCADVGEKFRTVRDEGTFDFGFIDEDRFCPYFFRRDMIGVGAASPAETLRYYLQATGENAMLPELVVCEFYWDGFMERDENGIAKETLNDHIQFRLVPLREADRETI